MKDLPASHPNLYHIWITVLIAVYEGKVIQGLVTKGYSVTAASGGSVTLTSNGSPSALIALRVEKENITAKIVYEDITFILGNIEAKYYSIVVSEYSQQSTWCGSNILLPEKVEIENKTVDKKLN